MTDAELISEIAVICWYIGKLHVAVKISSLPNFRITTHARVYTHPAVCIPRARSLLHMARTRVTNMINYVSEVLVEYLN